MDRMNWSRIAASLVALGAVIAGHPSARAATTTFTDSSAFVASLPTGFFPNNFLTVPDAFNAPVTSVSGTGGTPEITYTVTAPPAGLGVFPDIGFKAIGNWGSSNNLVVTFNSGNVFSAGGNIWLSDINGNRLAGNITVDFSDGSQIVVPSTISGALGFAGISTDGAPLTTMTLVAAGGSSYLNLTNLTVAVPEPSAIALLGGAVTCCAGWLVRRTRRLTI